MQSSSSESLARVALAAWIPIGSAQAQQFPPQGPSSPTAPASSPGAPSIPADDGGLFSPGLFLQLGFSFIVGLAVGFAVKIAFKIALVVGGILLVALFGLQSAELIDVNWSGMESSYDGFAGWLSAYGSGLKDFMIENLSSAASFTAGLLVGLKL